MKFSEYKQRLHESYDNFLPNDIERKRSIAKEVFDMIQKAYEPLGGMHGSGFKNPEDMVQNIPMWKVYRKGGSIRAVAMYKSGLSGRKRVAVATDGSNEGKGGLSDIMTNDLTQNRSYGESSGRSLQFLIRHVKDVSVFAIDPEKVKQIQPKDEFRDVPSDDPEIKAHPDLKRFFYQRKIGGDWHTKIALGSPGKRID